MLLTRWNLPSKGQESIIRAQVGWLESHLELFENYTVPSVAAQTVMGYHWIVYFDPDSTRWLLNRLRPPMRHLELSRRSSRRERPGVMMERMGDKPPVHEVTC